MIKNIKSISITSKEEDKECTVLLENNKGEKTDVSLKDLLDQPKAMLLEIYKTSQHKKINHNELHSDSDNEDDLKELIDDSINFAKEIDSFLHVYDFTEEELKNDELAVKKISSLKYENIKLKPKN